MASKDISEKQEFTIYETIYHEISIGDKVMHMETWIVDDTVMDWKAFAKPQVHGYSAHVMGRLLTQQTLDALEAKGGIRNKDVDGVALIRKRVADMATDYDLENLIKHEAAHLLLGHNGGQNAEQEEKEVRELIGESEIANDLFAVRYAFFQGINNTL